MSKFIERLTNLKFIRFGFVSVISNATGVTLSSVLFHFLGQAWLSSLSGFTTATFLSYVLNSRLTFVREQRSMNFSDLLKFFAVQILALVASTSFLYFLVSLELLEFWAAQVIVVVAVGGPLFFANKFWIFKANIVSIGSGGSRDEHSI